VLEGPQGTLFGAGAQAGAIRYITNSRRSTSPRDGYRGIRRQAGGDPNSDVTAVLNLPLIPGTLAIRGVIYDDHRGVTSTTYRRPSLVARPIWAYTTPTIRRCGAGVRRAKFPWRIEHQQLCGGGQCHQPGDLQGIRVSALWTSMTAGMRC